MMQLTVSTADGPMRVDVSEPFDVSIPYNFSGEQPCHFGAERASAVPLQAGSFVGDVRRGGSCNCEELRLIAHCNGTHTECVGHVTAERVSVHELVRTGPVLTVLLSVVAIPCGESEETSDPPAHAGDRLITASALEHAWRLHPAPGVIALIVRTLPNDPGKRTRNYSGEPPPPFLSSEAATLITARGIEHLLVDLPSIDRTHDEGRLSAHRIFWGMPAGSTRFADSRRPQASITEMIYVPDSIADGRYLLDLQVAPFVSDAAPSRPLLYRLHRP
ncbi:MAG TPA: cyclase family protein [Steroidobacteraceae bacterium]|nr:cyclase family protein [Steroidobacteraceae bacterium]